MGETIIAMVFPRQITMFVYRDGCGKGKTMMKATSYLEGRRIVTDFISPVGTELCPIELSSGRILAEDLIAAQNVPPFDRSPFDGYVAQNEFVNGWWCNKNGVQSDPVKYSWHKTSKGWWYGVSGGWYAKNATYTIDGKSYTFDKMGYQK